MYWTDWEEDPTESNRGKIKKAWMDGSHHQVFLTSKTVLWPNGLSLDISQGILYWVDAYYDRIEMVHLNTSTRKVVYEGQELNHAFGLCHYKQFLFWNEYRGGSIYKLDQASKTVTLLRNERPPIFEIRVYDAHQQQGTNACRLNNGGCSSLCLVIPDGRSCACADDQILDDDNVTCKDQHTCPADRFKCQNNRCIPVRWLCDGDNDCGNDEDESNTTCSAYPTCFPLTQFTCANGRCINVNWRCDNDNDCGDNSDESGCSHSCSSVQFKCNSGRCIPE
ncbi:hypothetical protein CRUP_036570, partial [Coryphaenoides rupestris]